MLFSSQVTLEIRTRHLSVCESLLWLRCVPSLILFSFLVSRGNRGTWRNLASQWVTADWRWPLSCLSGGLVNCWLILSLWLMLFQYDLYLLSLQTVGRRCILAPGCTRFTGPSRNVLVLFASTGDLQFTCRITYMIWQYSINCDCLISIPLVMQRFEVKEEVRPKTQEKVTIQNTSWQVKVQSVKHLKTFLHDIKYS